jgi:type II secretory pathway component PulF
MMDTSLALREPGTWTRLSWRLRPFFGDTVPKAALGPFFGALATLLASGQSIDAALLRAASGSDPELSWISARIAPALRRGVSLTAALAPYRHRLPEIVLPVLEVGEVAGTLEGASRRLEQAFTQSSALEGKIAHSVFNPWYVILGLAVIRAILSLAGSVIGMMTVLVTTLLALTSCYLGGRLLCRLLFRWQPLRLLIDRIKLALPQAGTVTRNLAMARWGRSFVTLWNSGVAISYAREVSSRSALNAQYERALQRAARHMRQGATLHQSLADAGMLPGYLLDILATSEMSGNFSAGLERFVILLEAEAFTKAAQQFMTCVAVGEIILIIVAFAAAVH